MIIVFDLDDTLYPESQFLESGLRAVAEYTSTKSEINSQEILMTSMSLLETFGRELVFDNMLKHYGMYSKNLVRKLISVYRSHTPSIRMGEKEIEIVRKLSSIYNLYLVTDGNKNVQASKIAALGIESLFRKIFITHRYGITSSKPSLKCFEKIREIENALWNEIVYVGDDPNKDFVNLNKVGAITIRVMTGRFAKLRREDEFEAMYQIHCLGQLPRILTQLGSRAI
jgi:putative hydrolase of the HAD superfamily